tara:strand:- start:979 stop:1233 length:255 start_codon:yes stop_codon:yes gene_type:complete
MTSNKNAWSKKSISLIKELHNELAINNIDWHFQKTNNKKRAAELIISSLSQLTNNGNNHDIEELLLHAIKWIKNEVKDPGCPNH